MTVVLIVLVVLVAVVLVEVGRRAWLGRSLEHGLVDAAEAERAVAPDPADATSIDLGGSGERAGDSRAMSA